MPCAIWAIALMGQSLDTPWLSDISPQHHKQRFSPLSEMEYDGHWPIWQIAHWRCWSRIEQFTLALKSSPWGRQSIVRFRRGADALWAPR